MKVFVANITGAVGKSLVPHLLKSGHEVVVLTRTFERARKLAALGAKISIANALDMEDLTTAIKRAAPELIIHQLTALKGAGGEFNDEEFELTNRFHTEVADAILAAATLVGSRRVPVQSFCGWPFAREGGPVKTKEDPLDPNPPGSFTMTLEAIRYLGRSKLVSETLGLQKIVRHPRDLGHASTCPVELIINLRT